MAGEAYLLSGDQIATFSTVHTSYPGGVATVRLNGIKTLGDADSRFFLVRDQGTGDTVTNGQFFSIYRAVDDGTGNLVPGGTPVVSSNYVTPDAYGGTAAGDDYLMAGLFGGPRFVIDINGIPKGGTYTAVQGQDVGGGNMDGEFNLSDLAAANPDGTICFASGTPIETPRGAVPVERLRLGDLVCTVDDGPRPIRWIGCTRVELTADTPGLAPIEIAANAFGPGLPALPVVVSPAHRLLMANARAQLLLGEEEVLVPAAALVNGTTVRRLTGRRSVTYWHLMFDHHQIVSSAGLPSESFHPGAYALDTLSRSTRAELLALFPELAEEGPQAYGATARTIVRGYEASLLSQPPLAA
ncbi:Hint domain-containing protein [Oceanicola sp. 502str15]|uniref:Hint domain-containing protein n=1 Tax=Oceanicola sp. 502str15 TaxID=2696061 RepID=UPI0020947F06|nr:Hint domain-containing protein [Oceanicola sp. 502str15]MCO6383753.1 hypothetical protein [Oceanicola sp. 502str15]